MNIKDIIEAYQDEISKWDFYSDSQKVYSDDNYIIVCLRDYDWYITKEKITDPLIAVKALFEITWLSEFNSEQTLFIDYSKYWRIF